ncbi:glyoxylase-like metal-dependent hydrolase (beta-lactamase superfamily II) [Prosthecobacter fusiformis]|uniref:Glyoxylase-like metal-dependent hydrolase (Beta-lactamase superfamily II) n=1 Tax=Prosthecobacter fusiformis TaxID=48464 RepID=A0A4R7S6N1_9BACT|nr:MBL fold metallo-hydrolase [Prosthecobacter fusiformis]TDU73105.1 glyoxylase-like metal-dependent hydrolase (beta-lactamase superfamily II) [Prosthecobacter fusiformis]
MLEPETYTGGIVETNGHVLRLPGGTLLVDAPEGVAAWLRAQNIRVDALLLTHQHFDHVLDAALVKSEHGCPIYAWSPFSRALTLEKFFGAATGSSFSVPEYTVDHVLEGSANQVSIAGVEWQLFHVPGHSADSVCFWQNDQQILMSGDVIFYGSLGRCDFPGGSFKQLVAGIEEKLWPLPEITRVYPGHGPGTTIGREKRENPFM